MGVKIPLTEKDVATIEAMSGWGMTMQQIAQVLKMNKRTLERRIKDTPVELGAAVALERGRAVAASVVARKCYEMASSGKEPGMTQFWLQCRADWKKTDAVEHSGPGGGPIETRDTSEKRMERIRNKVKKLNLLDE